MSRAAELAEPLAACVRRLNSRGWCEGTSGNYSVVVERDPSVLLLTSTSINKRDTRVADLMLVDGNARGLSPERVRTLWPEAGAHTPELRPSSEALLHTTLVECAGAGSVLHTHSVWGTLLGDTFQSHGALEITGYEMIKGIAGRTTHEETLVVPVAPNSQDMQPLAEALRAEVKRDPTCRGFLIAGHGLYTWGRDLAEAERHVEIFEFLFEVVGRRTAFWKENPWPR